LNSDNLIDCLGVCITSSNFPEMRSHQESHLFDLEDPWPLGLPAVEHGAHDDLPLLASEIPSSASSPASIDSPTQPFSTDFPSPAPTVASVDSPLSALSTTLPDLHGCHRQCPLAIPETVTMFCISTVDSALENKSFVCDFESCHGKFESSKRLIQHKRCHTKRYVCPEASCSRKVRHARFGTQRDLNRHLELIHNGARLQCPHCPNTVKRKDNLQRHILKLHPEKKPP